MVGNFPKALSYVDSLDTSKADQLDMVVKTLLYDEAEYERASQALRRRFVRGAYQVEGIDRGSRKTKIKREQNGGGSDGNWFEPDERIWVVAMYKLWQNTK
ncbi:MAG: hypothetical protein UT61_C0027G0017 [Candidatus Woesebacteria bacterium GW2011_GWA1_39_8]|uniref:Uncharacterized protein n=1 Tax=Candidatus Woesebacteria bacterium GW2011_GWA1_39_8 TaxID=1618552 RepID=A0A0G0PNZ2_9BACT|nr:MAG: hypothetical protein UT61_C0027G0017 [Candidatus Woesebacteria bacterium GW2011_GWA1_39_8]